MPLVKEDIYTIEDIYNLPEGERAELIDGQIYYMAPPSRKHQKIEWILLKIFLHNVIIGHEKHRKNKKKIKRLYMCL